jgi:ectoine hydroxylase-related dioxygenase (phytanoyl-CoA dioxygenase family)
VFDAANEHPEMVMDHDDVPYYGVLERRVVSDWADAHVEEIEYNGYTVVNAGLPASDLDAMRESIDRNHRRQLTETAAASAAATKIDSDTLRCPLAYDDIFLKAATADPLMEICRRLLGNSFVLLQQNAIINHPTSKEYQSRWHRDLLYQHFVASKKLALNALLCVDDFSVQTGGTIVLPGTHQAEAFPSAQFVRKYERTAEAPAGSFLILDAMLFHRSGYNTSGADRRGINHVIGRPLLVQQLDLPRLLDGRHANDPFLRDYLGYRWNPAPDVATWRMQRV